MTVVKMVKIEKVMLSSGKTAHELVCKGNVHVTLKFVAFSFIYSINIFEHLLHMKCYSNY